MYINLILEVSGKRKNQQHIDRSTKTIEKEEEVVESRQPIRERKRKK